MIWRAADIHGGAGQMLCFKCHHQCCLINQFAAREIDEARTRLHGRKGSDVEQMLGGSVGNREADHDIRSCQHFIERRLGNAWISDLGERIRNRNAHAERQGYLGKALTDAPIANYAKPRCGKLQPHASLRQAASAIGTRHGADIARQIHHEA